MDLRQLRYFVAVAEELHFTRAAQRLHLAQSALSAQIRSLEREVGAPLLERSTRRVTLTPVGETLLGDAREVLDRADRVLARARSMARREAGAISVGCLGAAPGELLPRAIAELGRRRPEATVEIHTFDFSQIQASLIGARVDLAFLYLPYEEEELRDVEVTPVLEEPRVVVLAQSHPLARRDALTPMDVADEVFLSTTPSVSQTWRDFWMLTEQLGRRPAIHERTADTFEEWLGLIAQGLGIDTAPEHVSRYYARPGIRFVPLADAPPATLVIVRSRGRPAPVVRAFLDAVRACAAPRAS
jgi:LysR family transcriptional regulator, benzoate and cis,cis-muconate-responsive activator of ben and cat genes